MICTTYQPCGSLDVSRLVAELLPKGCPWDLEDETRIHSQFWAAVVEAMETLQGNYCYEYEQANPCTATRNLERWAKLLRFPDCVELTTEKLCEWLALLNGQCAGPTLQFYRDLLVFLGIDDVVTVKFNTRPCVETTQRDLVFRTTRDRLRRWNLLEHGWGRPMCGCFIPQIECIRECLIPHNITVRYEATDVFRWGGPFCLPYCEC